MKQFTKGMIVGLIGGSMIFGTAAFATTGVKSIKAAYNNIKIVIDGRQVASAQEPFVYNGTTYVPLRFISESLGRTVDWNGQTNTVSIGSPVATKSYELNSLSYLSADGVWQTDGPKTDYTFYNIKNEKEEREDGMVAELSPYDYWSSVTYYTNKGYSRITGTLELLDDSKDTNNSAILYIYGDGKLVYQSPELSSNGKTYNVDVNIKNYQYVTIKIFAQKTQTGYKDIKVNFKGAKIYQ